MKTQLVIVSVVAVLLAAAAGVGFWMLGDTKGELTDTRAELTGITADLTNTKAELTEIQEELAESPWAGASEGPFVWSGTSEGETI
jgi:hypothetical protein